MKHLFFRFGLPLSLLLIFSLAALMLDADIKVARLVYSENEPWPGVGTFPWAFLYDSVKFTSFVLAGAGVLLFVLGFFVKDLVKYRSRSAFLFLLLIIGPGLIVNVLLKDHLGRARPKEIVEFKGTHQYTEMWQKGEAGKNSSFPSGHASAAFYLLAPWFLLRKKNRFFATCFLVLGLTYGSLVGIARIMQGGHFLSDVVWAGGLVYLSGEVLSLLLKLDNTE